MPSSFLICYPDITVSALTVTGSTYDTDYSVFNAFYGKRHNFAQLSTASVLTHVVFDLGTGNSRTIDHFILGGVKVLLNDGIDTALVQGSSDGVSWTSQLGATSFSGRTFNGPDGADIIFTATYNDQVAGSLAAYRYWRIRITDAVGSSAFTVSKMYFGASFDMGQEPAIYNMEVSTESDSDTWKAERGHTFMTKAFHPKHRFTVEWDGVTDAKAEEFDQKILKNPYRDYVWLYAANYQDPLYDNKLVYCKVVDAECEIVKEEENYNNIVAVFEESI